MGEGNLAVGVIVLIVLAVPTLFQVVFQGIERRKQHHEILERLDRLEERTSAQG